MAYTQMRGQAERDVKGALLLEKVADSENVEINEEEVTEEINLMAQQYRVTPEEIRASLKQQGGEANIESSLRTRKAVEALVNNAKITDGKWIDEDEQTKAATGQKKDEKASEPVKAAKKSKTAEKKTEANEGEKTKMKSVKKVED
jgi:trigger factor